MIDRFNRLGSTFNYLPIRYLSYLNVRLFATDLINTVGYQARMVW